MRRILIFIVAVLASTTAFVMVPASGAGAGGAGDFRVQTSITLLAVDQGPTSAVGCLFNGSTDQVISSFGGPSQLGAGIQGVDYPATRGPFRDAAGTAMSFGCGQIRVCFRPAQIDIDLDGVTTVDMVIGLAPIGVSTCEYGNMQAARFFNRTSPDGCGHVGLRPLLQANGDRVEFGDFCLTVTPFNAPVINRLDCESVDSAFTCTVAFTGGVGAVSIRWFLGGGAMPAFNNLTVMTGGCEPRLTYTVRVMLTDSTGASSARSVSPRCLGDPELD
jgi:hypothetical protein